MAVDGESKAYVRVAESGASATFRFCPECGCTVFYSLDAVPGAVSVPLGAFADPAFPVPRISVYEVSKHPWVPLPDDMEHLD